MAIGLGVLAWSTIGKADKGFSVITTEEIESFFRGASPEQLAQLAANPEEFEERLESIKDLFSIAGAAKDKFKDKPEVMHSLEIIEMLTWASTWDKEKHKDVGPMPPFGFITEEQINDYWGEGQTPTSAATVKYRQGVFERVAKTQLAMAIETGRVGKDEKLSEETLDQLRPEYTKIKIYEEEAKAAVSAEPQKWGWLTAAVSFQAKLQQAQFLAGLLNEDLMKQLQATDAEVKAYLEKNPDLGDKTAKLAKAQELIKKIEEGADFEELAKQHSEDPGSARTGGLIPDATLGSLVPPYEKAALALAPGEYTRTPVESQFGYHIIRLEKKEEVDNGKGGKELKFTTRHILISTALNDPSNPFSPPLSKEDFAKRQISEEKRKNLLDGIKRKYPVTIQPYTIPGASQGAKPAAPSIMPMMPNQTETK